MLDRFRPPFGQDRGCTPSNTTVRNPCLPQTRPNGSNATHKWPNFTIKRCKTIAVAGEILTTLLIITDGNGRLFELDGCKYGPVLHGTTTTPDSLLRDVGRVFGVFMSRDPERRSYSFLALAPKVPFDSYADSGL